MPRPGATWRMVDTPSPPQYAVPPPDPLYTQLQQQAATDQVNATQTQVRGDSASLMARYGALAGVTQQLPSLSLAAPSMQVPSTLPSGTMALGMALQTLGANMPGNPLAAIARSSVQGGVFGQQAAAAAA